MQNLLHVIQMKSLVYGSLKMTKCEQRDTEYILTEWELLFFLCRLFYQSTQ